MVGLIVSFGMDFGYEFFIVVGIVNVGEYKVVLYEDVVFVIGSYEGVGSVDIVVLDVYYCYIGIVVGLDKVVILLGSY